MNKIYKHLLAICIFSISSASLFSQSGTNHLNFVPQDICDLPCNDTLDIEPAFTCDDAANSAFNGDGPGFVCNLNGYCTNTVDVPPGNNAPFCNGSACVLNNPIWFSFIATSNYIDIDVCPHKCQGGGGGLQWALYDQCSNLLNAVACQCTPVLPGDSLFSITANVTNGATYYLVIDGFSGSTCAIQFRVNEGLSGVPVGDLISDVLEGPTPVCKPGPATYSSQGYLQASQYQWTIDGTNIGGDDLSVSVDINGLSPGTHTLCLQATNECSDGLWKEHCWEIEVVDKPLANAQGEACEGSTYTFKGNNYSPGSYSIEVPATDGSGCDTTYTLVVDQLDKSQGPDVKLAKCAEHNTINYLGVDYSTTFPYQELHYTNAVGCDSLVRLYISDLTITGDIIPDKTELPCDGGVAVLMASYSHDLISPPNATTEVFWYDKDFNQIAYNTDQIAVTQPGTYYCKIVVTIDNPDGAADEVCEKLLSVTITVEDSQLFAPNVNKPPFICAGNTGAFNVTDIFPPGTLFNWAAPGGDVSLPNNGQFVDITYDSAGTYQICVTPEDACGPGPKTCITIDVYPAPDITAFGQDSVCSLIGNLTATIGNVPNGYKSGLDYHWTKVSGPGNVVFEHPDSLNTKVTVDTAGIYVFNLSVDYDGKGCINDSNFTFVFQEQLVLATSDTIACNASGQANPYLIDLDNLISGNVPYTGTWKFVSGAGAPITIGAGNIVDFSSVPKAQIGTYIFEFKPNAFGFCTPGPDTVYITVENCICPTLDINPSGPTVCNDGPTVDLSTLVNTGTAPGKWTLNNGPVGNTLNMTNPNNLNFNGQPSGAYTFTYSLNDTSITNCPRSANTVVNVVAAPSAVLVSTISVCNKTNALGLPYTMDFDTLVKSGDMTGTWLYTGPGVNPAAGTLPLLDFTGVTPGTYSFSYTIDGGTYCKDVTYSINVIVEDCRCPSVAIIKSNTFCSSDIAAQVDLSTYLITTQPGKWTLQSQPVGGSASISANTFNGQNSAAGQYVIVFTLDNPSPDPTCPDTSQLVITLDNAPVSGTANNIAYCVGSKDILDMNTRLTGADAGGQWTYNTSSGGNIGAAFNAATGRLDIGQLTNTGTYEFIYTVSSQLGLCADALTQVEVTINELPVADAGSGFTLTCAQNIVTLNGANSTSGPGITYAWTKDANPTVLGTNNTLPGVSDAGTYTILVTNTNTGCQDTSTVVVAKDNNVISAIDTSISPISCYNLNDGAFSVNSVTGGTPPFEYSMNGGPFNNQSSFNNLAAGTYSVAIKDANGCQTVRTFTLTNPTLLQVNVGPDRSIRNGDTVNITGNVTINVNDVASWVWTSDPPGSPTGSQTINVTPDITTQYTLVVKNSNGCVATDFMTVTVRSIIRIYVPNVITPNGDNINDVFYVQADRNIKQIKKMVIYNRWGDQQFEAENFPPNDPSYGWNGKFKTKPNDPAVFVYWAELEYRDGYTEIIKGDVTVIR